MLAAAALPHKDAPIARSASGEGMLTSLPLAYRAEHCYPFAR